MILTALSSIVAVLVSCGGHNNQIEDNVGVNHQQGMDDALHGCGRYTDYTPEERGVQFICHLNQLKTTQL
jgi:hypothetical protein